MLKGRVVEVLHSVAANIRATRLRCGLTQEVLSERANVDLRFLQKVETARSNLSIDVLVRIADALEVKPGLLLRTATLPTPRRGRPKQSRLERDLLSGGSASHAAEKRPPYGSRRKRKPR